MDVLTRLVVGLLCSTLIGGLGFTRGSLTHSGWLGAVLVGSFTLGFGGWLWGLLVVIFFASSSALSKLGRQRKQRLTQSIWEKSDQRDLIQVAANGGVPTLAALGYFVAPSPFWWATMLGAIAAATADTWATEIGVLSRQQPRHVLSGQPLPMGTSGGVSWAGTLGGVAGAALIGLVAWLGLAVDGAAPFSAVWSFVFALVGGIAGSLLDSLLGATVQQLRWCPVCKAPTEQTIHHCGTLTLHHHGLPWLNNDAVNLVSIVLAACFTAALWLVLLR